MGNVFPGCIPVLSGPGMGLHSHTLLQVILDVKNVPDKCKSSRKHTVPMENNQHKEPDIMLRSLGQACLSWWNVVSPFGGWGSTLALLFVLVVAGIKAIWEDLKRHQEDRSTNGSVAHRVMPDGE